MGSWIYVALALCPSAGCTSLPRETPAEPPPLIMATAVPATPAGEDVVKHLARFRTGDEEQIRGIVDRLEGHVPRPWTVERLAAAFAAALDEKRAADLVYLLAASKDPMGLRIAGNSIDHESLDIRAEAAIGIWTYWLEVMSPVGNLETIMSDVSEWWEERRAVLLKEEQARDRTRRRRQVE